MNTKEQSKYKVKPIIIGVAGGSGSGKTHFAKLLYAHLGAASCSVINQDDFYKDQSSKFDFDGGAVNFDHPSSLDFTLLENCLCSLKNGKETKIPNYDFATHKRKNSSTLVVPTKWILVDGILIFHPPGLRNLLDIRFFFETAESLRFTRRLKRDTIERGRTESGVRQQFELQVKPMHDQFVEPSKVHAHEILGEVAWNAENMSRLLAKYHNEGESQ